MHPIRQVVISVRGEPAQKNPVKIETARDFDPIINRAQVDEWIKEGKLRTMTVAEIKTQAMLLEAFPVYHMVFTRVHNAQKKRIEVCVVTYLEEMKQFYCSAMKDISISQPGTILVEEFVPSIYWLNQHGLVMYVDHIDFLSFNEYESISPRSSPRKPKAQWKNERKPFSKRK